jgi:2-polyprenyl-3-methyl-5-hydroxy-6-metoxy-1,4-benzoquinol methylase
VDVTDESYDKNVLIEGEEFQVRNYYFPNTPEKQRRIEFVLSHLKPALGDKVLDLGCGVGTFAFHTAKAGAFSHGIDYSTESIKMARKLCARFKIEGSTEFRVGDVSRGLPYGDEFFDKIVCADFIEHIYHEDKVRILMEVRRVLKKGGVAVFYTPNQLREILGEVKGRLGNLLGGSFRKNPLHLGLIYRKKFEAFMKAAGLKFNAFYFDEGRPYIARLPLLRRVLALNLLWRVSK